MKKTPTTTDDLRDAYAEMAKDRAREHDALEWAESLLADSISD